MSLITSILLVGAYSSLGMLEIRFDMFPPKALDEFSLRSPDMWFFLGLTVAILTFFSPFWLPFLQDFSLGVRAAASLAFFVFYIIGASMWGD